MPFVPTTFGFHPGTHLFHPATLLPHPFLTGHPRGAQSLLLATTMETTPTYSSVSILFFKYYYSGLT